MQSEFEKDMQHRMEDFHVSPSPQVWERVEAALPAERKRRFIFWWILPLFLLMGSGYWLITRKTVAPGNITAQQITEPDTRSRLVRKSVAIPDSANTNQAKVPAASANRQTSTSNKKQALQQTINSSANAATPSSQVINQKVKLQQPARSQTVVITANPSSGLSRTALKEREDASYAGKKARKGKANIYIRPAGVSDPDMPSTNETGEETRENLITNLAPGSRIGNPAAAETVKNGKDTAIIPGATAFPPIQAPQVTAAQVPESLTKKKEDSAKHASIIPAEHTSTSSPKKTDRQPGRATWKLSVMAAASNTKSAVFGASEKAADFRSYANSSTGSINSPLTAPATAPRRKMAFGLGIERAETFRSSRFGWYGKGQYQYLSNLQATGAAKDSLLRINTDATVPRFYFPGDTSEHTNTVHQLGFAAGVRYHLSQATAKKPLLLSTGLLLNWQLASRQLFSDSRLSAYYYNSSNTRRLTAGWEAALDWTIGKGYTIGVFYQYNFSTIDKSSNSATPLHWQAAGAKFSLALTKSHQ